LKAVPVALFRSPDSERMIRCRSDRGGNPYGPCNGAQLVEYLGLSREHARTTELPR
jgi:hypothetical protein